MEGQLSDGDEVEVRGERRSDGTWRVGEVLNLSTGAQIRVGRGSPFLTVVAVIIMVVVALGFLAAIGFGIFVGVKQLFDSSQSSEISVPAVSGLYSGSAFDVLHDARLDILATNRAGNRHFEWGHVVRTDPPPGAEADNNTPIAFCSRYVRTPQSRL